MQNTILNQLKEHWKKLFLTVSEKASIFKMARRLNRDRSFHRSQVSLKNLNIPLTIKKAGTIWCSGTRETH